MLTNSITLTDNKIAKLIHRNRFLISIFNNMRNRQNTTSSSCSDSDGVLTSDSSDIVKELRFLEQTEWSYHFNLEFGKKGSRISLPRL